MNFKKSFLFFVLSLSFFACNKTESNEGEKESNLNIDSKMTKEVENITPKPDQMERRTISEKFCKSKEIPVYKNPNSLFVASEEDVKIRVKDEVVNRALALFYIGLKSEGLEKVNLDMLDSAFNISTHFTDAEKQFVFSVKPTQQQITDANWKYESLHVLLWSLGYVDSLSYPVEMCNVETDVSVIFKLGEKKFREEAKLRSSKEILDAVDLILRLDWACVNARVKNESAPSSLNPSIVYERHFALNWLINHQGQDWDFVTTDT